MTLSQAGALLGGLGLFLLGMAMLTDGLKMAAGHSLRQILGRWTCSPLRGVSAGFFVTALVQSSSAVTVAAIGFVNAGLLTLPHAVWVVYGANVGTTMTAWIVSLVGLKLKIGLAAMPAIGIGMFLRLLSRTRRMAAYGDVIAGFGLFFMGISVLSETFAGFTEQVDVLGVAGTGYVDNLMFLGLGFLVTVLTQSSSASIAIALTAAAGGLMTLEPAAAMVIGANLGTTSTGLFAVIGATPPAKRVAVAHLLFNLVTGGVAIGLLPVFIGITQAIGHTVTLLDHPAVFLALFHTLFNVVGVLIMWPLARPMTSWLARRFVTEEEDEARLHYLDESTAALAQSAADGVVRELDRVSGLTGALLENTVTADAADDAYTARRAGLIETVAAAINRYLGKLYAGPMTVPMADGLVHAARAALHFSETAEITRFLAAERQALSELPEQLRAETQDYARLIGDAARRAGHGGDEEIDWQDELDKVREAYRTLKDAYLTASARQGLNVETLDGASRSIWHMRRAAVQLIKARRRIEQLRRVAEAVRQENGQTAFDDSTEKDGVE